MLPGRIKKYLNERCISDEIIERAQLSWDESTRQIVIPVFDKQGKHLFNKYRRDPEVSTGAKYKYDTGACGALYGRFPDTEHRLRPLLVLTEGELDTLVLQSLGCHSFSTTGGSSTFDPNWIGYWDAIFIHICYDADEAGVKGAIKVAQEVRDPVTIIQLPWGMDVTDYFKAGHSIEEFADLYEIKIRFPKERTEKMYKSYLDTAIHMQRKIAQEGKSMRWIDEYIKVLNKEAKDLKAEIKRKKFLEKNIRRDSDGFEIIGYNTSVNELDVELALAEPITNYIDFNGQGFATSIWKDEKTPSMKYYPDTNRVWCYASGKGGDVIDVVQKLRECDFKEAISVILG